MLEKAKGEVEKEKKQEEMIQIVDKLPVQEVRSIMKDGVKINFLTVEEYLTLQANQRND